jgi:hypothetical protein
LPILQQLAEGQGFGAWNMAAFHPRPRLGHRAVEPAGRPGIEDEGRLAVQIALNIADMADHLRAVGCNEVAGHGR